jgi:hypothetical protein
LWAVIVSLVAHLTARRRFFFFDHRMPLNP